MTYKLLCNDSRKKYGTNYLAVTKDDEEISNIYFSLSVESHGFLIYGYGSRYNMIENPRLTRDVTAQCTCLYECETTEQMDEYLNKMIIAEELVR